MCGHVGIAGKMELKDEALMRRLLVFDYFRGPDSTGFAALRKDGTHRLAKIASNPLNLFDMKRFSEANNGYQSLAFVGHNRFATKGKVNDLNAHPFHYGNIVGAHNGTLEKSSWDALDKKLGEDTDVDSQAIIKSIATFGIEETVPLLQGAWALVWFDMEAKTLNFLRNDERTLWWAMNKDLNKFFWASEYKMIDLAVHNCKGAEEQELWKSEKNHSFFSFKEDYLYSIPLTELASGYKQIPDFRGKKLEGKGGSYGVAPFKNQSTKVGGTKTCTAPFMVTSTTKSHGKPTVTSVTVEVVGSPKYPFGENDYTKDVDFQTLAVNGCSWCRETIDFEQPGITLYTERDIVLCPSCGTNHEKQTKVYVPSLVLVK